MAISDAQRAAEWMFQQVTVHGVLRQDVAAYYIATNFTGLTYRNRNGNPAIEKSVLGAFRKLGEDEIVWQRGGRFWRLRTQHDPVGKRQVG